MPGEGFSTRNYNAIARHFYQKYHYPDSDEQNQVFHQVVLQLLHIVDKEHQTGIWSWCTLKSGKE